jgi:hypothetical protein
LKIAAWQLEDKMTKRPLLNAKEKLLIKSIAFIVLIAVFTTGVSGTLHDFSTFLGRF